jgi:hypothetical protein
VFQGNFAMSIPMPHQSVMPEKTAGANERGYPDEVRDARSGRRVIRGGPGAGGDADLAFKRDDFSALG